jgi:hypothetical protein
MENTARSLAQISEHIATIRSLADNVHSCTPLSHHHRADPLLCQIKIECHIIRQYLIDMMPVLTDEKIV